MTPIISLVLLAVVFNISPALSAFSSSEYNGKCRESSSWIKGPVPSVFCAFHKDGSLNTEIIESYANNLVKKGVKVVIANDPSFGCNSLSTKEKRKNLFEWTKIGKGIGLTVIPYISGCSINDIIEECNYGQQLSVSAIMIGESSNNKFNTTLRVEYVKEIASKVSPIPIILDTKPERFDCPKTYVTKLFIELSKVVPNFWGIRGSVKDCVEIISTTELSRCQGLLSFSTLLYGASYAYGFSGDASYVSSIYPEDSSEISKAFEENKPASVPVLLNLKLNKKFAPIFQYLAENYDLNTYAYSEPLFREYFICVTKIKIGWPRYSSAYKLSSSQRRYFKSLLEKNQIYCGDKRGDKYDDKEDRED